MTYRGQKVAIPLGKFGVRTDDPQMELAPGELVRVENVDLSLGVIQSEMGSRKWSQTILPGNAKQAVYWSPNEAQNFLVTACSDGQLYRFKNQYRYDLILPNSTAEATLTPSEQGHFAVGGRLSATQQRKLFYFSGNNQVQVVEGSTLSRRAITKPAIEWTTGNYPRFGMIFRNRLVVLGTPSDPYLVLMSTSSDQEDFQTTGGTDPILTFRVFPGEGERLVGGTVFRGKLFVWKYPYGIYTLVDDDADPDNWYFKRVSTTLGASSAHAMTEAIDDVIFCNQWGDFNSLAAAFQLGDIKFSDITDKLRCTEFLNQEVDRSTLDSRWMIYHSEKKKVYCTFRDISSQSINKMVVIDVNNQHGKMLLNTKDTVNSLFLMKELSGKSVPAYCGVDGYIYTMDGVDRNVNGAYYYSEFRTPQMDFGSEMGKNFDFLEIEAEHTGDWKLYCDVYIEDSFVETIDFDMSAPPVLAATATSACFQLDQDRLMGRQTRSQRKKLHGTGKEIYFRFRTDGVAGHSFRLAKLVVYLRSGNEDEKE